MRRLAVLLLAGALGWSSGGMAEEAGQAEAAVAAEAIKAPETTEAIKATETTGAAEAIKAAETTETTEATEATEATEPTKTSGAVEATEAIKATETETTETPDATERWSVCTDSTVLPGQLLPIAARIAARVAQDSADVLVNVVPQDEGSAEFLLASTSEVFAQLRNVLVARRVPYRRVNFQWRSASGAIAEIEPSPCRGVAVVVEVTVDGS